MMKDILQYLPYAIFLALLLADVGIMIAFFRKNGRRAAPFPASKRKNSLLN